MEPKTKKNDSRKGDDRNLVLVDQDFGQPDLEDRMFLFWIRNKVLILGLVALAVAGSVGAIVFAAYSSHRLAALQGEYTVAKTAGKPEALLAFAKANAGQPLALVAALDAADQLYTDKKFDEAAKAYALVTAPAGDGRLLEAAFAGRAALGAAFSELYAGRAEQAAKAFTAAQANARFPAGLRGQALHSLALLAIEKDDLAAARKWLDTMDKILPPNDPWLLEKTNLLERVPALVAPIVRAPAPPPAETPAAAQSGTGGSPVSPPPAPTPQSAAVAAETPAAPAAAATTPAPAPPAAPSTGEPPVPLPAAAAPASAAETPAPAAK